MATFIKTEDYSYWRATRWDNEGQCVMAQGQTEAEAETLADQRLELRNSIIALAPKDRLRYILRTDDLTPRGLEIAVRLLARIVLDS